jgi:hypothetical protein
MALDVAVQLASTIAVLMAMQRSSGVGYQLSTVFALEGIIGPAYCLYPGMFLKIFGAQLLAKRMHDGYIVVARATFATNILIGAAVTVAIFTGNAQAWAQYWGASACVYAGTDACAPLYHEIFSAGGMDSVIKAFGVMCIPICAQLSLRFNLVTMCDFDFLWKAAVASFVCGFLPAILITRFVFPDNGTAYYVASQAPHILLLPIMGARCWYNLSRMERGESGPWEEHAIHEKGQLERSSSNLELSPTGSDQASDADYTLMAE